MENLLHYIWKFRLFKQPLQTTSGDAVEVIDCGLANTDEGPDFFNAKIKIGNTLWVGNIEIHLHSKDWFKHAHEQNKIYDSVILHIVERADCCVVNSLGQEIAQCEISYDESIKNNYEFLIHSDKQLPCANFIGDIPSLKVNAWMSALLIERLSRKSEQIKALLKIFNNSWEDVFYITVARNFGFGLNADIFERLAMSLPLRCIQKHRNNIVQIEALLLGQAGLLDFNVSDDLYMESLKKEYTFLSCKFGLTPIRDSPLKKLRVRPNGFPQIRIAQLASLLYSGENLFSKIISCPDLGSLRLLFHVNASEYWQTHYSLGNCSEKKSKYIGDSSLNIILINTVVPLLFMYGKITDDTDIQERAIDFLENIPAEKNRYTQVFSSLGIVATHAGDSQALLQLKKDYCELRKCLFCRIGHVVFNSNCSGKK